MNTTVASPESGRFMKWLHFIDSEMSMENSPAIHSDIKPTASHFRIPASNPSLTFV